MEDVEVSTERGNLEEATAPEKNGEKEAAGQKEAAGEADSNKPKHSFGKGGRPRNTPTKTKTETKSKTKIKKKKSTERKKINRVAQVQRATARKFLKQTAGEHAERWETVRDTVMVFKDVPIPQMDPMFSGMLLDSFGEKSTPLRSCIGFHGWKDVRYSDSLVKEITGVSLQTFHILLEQLPDPLPVLGGLTTENGLLMFLMKLRMNPPYKYLAAQFSVAQATIEHTFLCILLYLVELSSACIQWPLKETVISLMPQCIKRSYPKCRLVLDCLQIEVEAPEQLRDQLPMLSRLDSTFKAKALIGLTPNGCICFISKFFSGEISQSRLSKLSSVYYALHVGDDVLSLQPDSFISSMQGVSVYQAPILPRIVGKTNPVYKEEFVLLNNHIDLLKQRLRSFGILRSKLPCNMLPYMEMLVHICAVLANLETAVDAEAEDE